MSELFIREARGEDIARITEIESASFSDPWSEARLLSETDKKDDRFFVVTDGKEIFGYAIVCMGIGGNEAELYDIAVDTSARGRGIGDMLMDFMTDEAKKSGTERIYLEVRETNAAALALYEKHGFTAFGRRRGYYRKPTEDAILMSRVL